MKWIFLSLILLFSVNAQAQLSNDSRMKLFVYDEYQVYKINTSLGYQSTIELSKDEKIRTISVGNSSLFKITPMKSRIFIKPLINGMDTNMAVITDKRAYQFDIISKKADTNIAYTVRFYYPEDIPQMGHSPSYGPKSAGYAMPSILSTPPQLFNPTPILPNSVTRGEAPF